VINQDQVGPMTEAEVQQRFSSGEIDGETYAWREGFADWLPLAQIDVFAEFVASASAGAPAADGGGGADAVASMFGTTGMGDEAGTMRSDPGDLFAAASAGSRRGEDDGDLFGSKPGTGSRQPVAGGSADAAAAAAAKLRGERNENSVLFSLNNLAQLASDKPAPVTAPPSSMGHATGAAGGEGSGLIDIRSMANAYLGGPGGAAKPATSSAIGSIDDLPVFGGGGFSEPAVIVPTARPAANNKMMFLLIGAVGLLAVAAVVLVVVMLGKDDPKPQLAAATEKDDKDEKDGDSAAKEPDQAGETKPDPAAAGTPPKTPETEAPKTPETEAPKATDDKPRPASGGTRPTRSRVATAPKSSDRKPAETKPADSGGGSCDEVSCVLNNYEGTCCQKFRKGGSRPSSGGSSPRSGGSDLPERLDRAMISEGVARVKSRVMACGSKSSAKGQVKVSVKVSPSGSISSVSVASTPDPGLGSCVASAMRGASFRKTQSGGSFGYPFVF
jgi:outer membrane biosynthesis protein TonB